MKPRKPIGHITKTTTYITRERLADATNAHFVDRFWPTLRAAKTFRNNCGRGSRVSIFKQVTTVTLTYL